MYPITNAKQYSIRHRPSGVHNFGDIMYLYISYVIYNSIAISLEYDILSLNIE